MSQKLVHIFAPDFEIWSGIGFLNFFPSAENIAKLAGFTDLVRTEHLKSIKFGVIFPFSRVIWIIVAIFMGLKVKIFNKNLDFSLLFPLYFLKF